MNLKCIFAITFIINILFVFSIVWADDVIKNACPDGVRPNKALVKSVLVKHVREKNSNVPGLVLEDKEYKTDLMNEKGKCYKVDNAKFEYLIDERHAIYRVYIESDVAYITPQLMLFEYINSKVKNRQISGVIKGSGEYFNYKDNQGVPRTMPRMIVVKEN